MNIPSQLLQALLVTTLTFSAGCASEVVSEGGDGSESQGPITSGVPTEPAAADECDRGAQLPCELENAGWSGTTQGYQVCVDWYGPTVWTECLDTMDPCALVPPGETCNTPLVLVWDERAVEFSSAQTATFDLSGMGMSHGSDWPTAATPWLALDRDGDGAITSGEELFGSATVLASGVRAQNGFDALSELDENHDGLVSAADARFGELLVWSDADGDRTSSTSELSRAGARLVSIELGHEVSARCDTRGNCEGERSRFTYQDPSGALRTGTVVDVYLRGR